MSNIVCPICLENIYILYYKSKQCKCNIRYHLSCVNKWYKINNICIYCKKKDNKNNIDIDGIINKYIELFIIFINFIIFFILYIYYANYK